MPQHKSAKKRIRQNERRRLRNVVRRSRIKTSIKKVQNAPDKKTAEAEFRQATALLDRYSMKHLIHKNKAANLKSKLSKVVAAK